MLWFLNNFNSDNIDKNVYPEFCEVFTDIVPSHLIWV